MLSGASRHCSARSPIFVAVSDCAEQVGMVADTNSRMARSFIGEAETVARHSASASDSRSGAAADAEGTRTLPLRTKRSGAATRFASPRISQPDGRRVFGKRLWELADNPPLAVDDQRFGRLTLTPSLHGSRCNDAVDPNSQH